MPVTGSCRISHPVFPTPHPKPGFRRFRSRRNQSLGLAETTSLRLPLGPDLATSRRHQIVESPAEYGERVRYKKSLSR